MGTTSVMDLRPAIQYWKGLRPAFPELLNRGPAGAVEDPFAKKQKEYDSRMKPVRTFPETSVLMAGCVATALNSSSDWHSFPFDEFYLICVGSTLVGIEGKKYKMGNDTLVLIRQGEKRGYWNVHHENPTFASGKSCHQATL